MAGAIATGKHMRAEPSGKGVRSPALAVMHPQLMCPNGGNGGGCTGTKAYATTAPQRAALDVVRPLIARAPRESRLARRIEGAWTALRGWNRGSASNCTRTDGRAWADRNGRRCICYLSWAFGDLDGTVKF